MKKKGAMWIAYILATLFFVGLAVTIIIWGKTMTEESTESTINMVSGRMDCREVRLHAEAAMINGNCNLIITNKGTLNIHKVLVRYGETQEEVDDLKIEQIGGSKTKSLSWDGKVSLLPVLEVNEKLIGCKDKTLDVDCAI